MGGQDNMNTTEAGSNFTLSSSTENITLSSLTTTTISPTIPQPPSYFSDIHDPEITIMVVLGLSLLLAGFAAFLAVCRRSEQDGDSETSCSPGESLTHGRSRSSEPQLKVWKRLGSYRRSYNLSFRRPPPRRPQERESTHVSRSPVGQTPQAEASVEPHLTMPCLFDYDAGSSRHALQDAGLVAVLEEDGSVVVDILHFDKHSSCSCPPAACWTIVY
ncbi:hypothetical protein INR49_009816, partial [Caranx melampygus]